MKFVLIVPDGMGIRNFLCTPFVDHLLGHGEVRVWHGLTEATVGPHRERWGEAVGWHPLPAFREGLRERILRQAKVFAQLYWRYREDAGEVQLRFRRPRGRLITRQITLAARFVGRLCAHPRGLAWLERRHRAATAGADYFRHFAALVAREAPQVVFCTHQRASRAVPAMAAAARAGVPTATFIYSWDNLPKGRMAVAADHFLVWSEAMRDELLSYYPEVDPARLWVVGTPQFEPYFDPRRVLARDDFLAAFGLDPRRPVVCFSGDDVTTSPHDPVYLADLAVALAQAPAASRPQILFRRCPVDLSGRYQAVLDRHPEIVCSDPAWTTDGTGDWTNVVPTPADVGLLVNVVMHCDLVVNVGSTMAMDFAIADKPGLFIAYDPPAAAGTWRIDDLYRLPHFRSVHELQPVHWVRSAAELGEEVLHALRHPGEKAPARAAWLEREVKHPLAAASRRCVEALVRLASSVPGRREHGIESARRSPAETRS